MKVKVKFYADFKKLFDAEREVELEDQARIQDLLNKLCDTDERRQEILDSSGKIKPSVMVMLRRGQRSDVVDKEHTELKDGDLVMVLRTIFGG